ncbi:MULTISPECIES: AAA family ATPase [unclassified Beijerinckia]|uniref:AAA family ATPase n=1 Tax=unclassified Beijerinckia TaxID=2638183 RepID=UPI000895AC93|nr:MULTISPECIES: AAA family ATPase [unclassified Beijerinckia]MDH7798134.1 putative ATPase [Beijerinckia sp. GAS462]SED10253.1 Predicted ATPase [Beijerinckia sp. 28-YEA-48]
MIHSLAISGYRSIRDLVLPLARLTIVTGRNGTGKSSFYRALRLLAEVAQGRVITSLATEGGLPSTLWAGPEQISRSMRQGIHPIQGTVRKSSVALRLGFAAEDYGYAIDLGFPVPGRSMFNLDPEIKAEAVWAGDVLSKRNMFAARSGPAVTALDRTGRRVVLIPSLPPYESMMTHAADPRELAELLVLRERMRGWRFYDHFRTDAEAPARSSRIGTRTQALSSDGGDLAAALQTIREIGDNRGLDIAIDDAFSGASIEIKESGGKFDLLMHQQGLLRSLRATELSDGTLRYLLLLAALLTPRPPGLMVLNEPETSLHPDLLAPLARLIQDASKRCQIIVVTHADTLAQTLEAAGALSHELKKDTGETTVEGINHMAWQWPNR